MKKIFMLLWVVLAASFARAEEAPVLPDAMLPVLDVQLEAGHRYSASLSRKENMIKSCDEAMKYISSLADPHKYHYVVVLSQ